MKVSILFLCIFFQMQCFAQLENKNKDGKNTLAPDKITSLKSDSLSLSRLKAMPVSKLEIPKINSKESVITHTGYSFVYNETHEQAKWIAYELTKKETDNVFKRTDKFLPDPEVKTGTATDKDYEASGYDRGHLAPAADMGWSEIAIAESFFYSNMSPQEPGFNRGIWKKTEALVRNWAIENQSLYIVTGPVLSKGLKSIGKNNVSVPNYYYKVILDYSEPGIKGIGFLMPNTPSKNSPADFTVSIDSIEKVTGIDFYASLPDDQEALIEKTVCIDCWTWNFSNTPNDDEEAELPVNEEITAVQCSGQTQAKKRCKRMTKSPNGLCSQHGGN